MGLDMFLSGDVYISKSFDAKRYEDISTALGTRYASLRVNGISFELGYWRKANHIHAWFVKNVQDGVDDCEKHSVSESQLNQLLTTCREVLKNPERGPELLPREAGFFFGGTGYDERYLQDIRDTVRIIENIPNSIMCLESKWYRASW